MDKIVINGGHPLQGTIEISGAKNAVLPIMAATLLADGVFRITNVPDLRDVKSMAHLLRIIGAKVEFRDNTLEIDTSTCNFFEAPYEIVKTMRASIYVLGPLLAKFGQARVSLPGGCAIGTRPVDLHIKGLQQLGATIDLERGYVVATARHLSGSNLNLDVSSVGATGNLLMAAVLAQGKTTINNASWEPEIVALADFLVKMGARIDGVGTARLTIHGVTKLEPVQFEVIPDRIETGTFLIAAALAGGRVQLNRTNGALVNSLIAKLRHAGAQVEAGESTIVCEADGRLKPTSITTAAHPGFPTDLQAQWMALMCVAEGSSIVTDTVFFDRFMHVAELRRLGANIEMNGNVAVVTGVAHLVGAPVMSTDLRASASLILAGLGAEGQTDVLRVYHLDRGYERIENKLRSLGAQIRREEGSL